MMKKIFAIFCLSFFIGGIIFYLVPKSQTMTVQGQIPLKTKSELITESEVIIRGTVNEILPSKWSNPDYKKGEAIRNILQTDISINIKEIFSGIPYDKKNILVRIDKCLYDNIKVASEGYPDFIIGEDLILFLSKDDSDVANPDENYYVLTGMSQGKFILNDKSTNGTEYVSSFKGSNDKILLSNFKEEIKNEFEYQKLNPKKKLTPDEIREQNEKVLGK